MRHIHALDKKAIDRQLERLDTHGVSRRDFARLATAGIAMGAAARALGLPTAAIAAPNGKIAYMYFSSRLQYCLTVKKSVEDTTGALKIGVTSADAELNSEHELDQYEQLAASPISPARTRPGSRMSGRRSRGLPRSTPANTTPITPIRMITMRPSKSRRSC